MILKSKANEVPDLYNQSGPQTVAGYQRQIPTMSDSLTGHEILNHLGRRIRVSQHSLRSLDMRHYLRRDRATGLMQFKPELIGPFCELEGGDHHSKFFDELGRDCQGANVVICKCRECGDRISDLDHTRMSHEHTRNLVRSVRARA